MAPPGLLIYDVIRVTHNQLEISIVHQSDITTTIDLSDAIIRSEASFTAQQLDIYLASALRGVITTPYGTSAAAIAAAKAKLLATYYNISPFLPTTGGMSYNYSTDGTYYYPCVTLAATGGGTELYNVRIEVPHSLVK